MNPHLLWILVVVAIAAVALLKPRRRSSRSTLDRPWPLEAPATLLSQPEQVLYRRLVQALPEHIVLTQVQLLRTVRFKRGVLNRNILNRISQLSIDFLILNSDTSIVAAVELDDSSHQRADRQWADERKTHALESAAIPLLRWNVRKLPDVPAIGAALTNLRAAGSIPQ